jgi:hypothetical protein
LEKREENREKEIKFIILEEAGREKKKREGGFKRKGIIHCLVKI